jgi:hypothetical protein
MNIAGALLAIGLLAWERVLRRPAVQPQPAAAPATVVPAAPTTAAEQRAMLDRLGIKGSGEAE